MPKILFRGMEILVRRKQEIRVCQHNKCDNWFIVDKKIKNYRNCKKHRYVFFYQKDLKDNKKK